VERVYGQLSVQEGQARKEEGQEPLLARLSLIGLVGCLPSQVDIHIDLGSPTTIAGKTKRFEAVFCENAKPEIHR